MISVTDDLSKYRDKRVLFITTKKLSYIRNAQEISLLKEVAATLDIVGSEGGSYISRLPGIILRLAFVSYKKYDVVFAGFAPQLTVPLYGRRIKRAGCTLVEDFFISLYDTFCFDRKKFAPDSFFGRLLFRLDKKTIVMADEIICDTKTHGEYFYEEFLTGAEDGGKADHLRTTDKSIKVLYLEADKKTYHPMHLNKSEVLERYFGSGIAMEGTVVLYFGSVLPLQGTDIVLEAMRRLVKTGKYICIFIGPVCKGISHEGGKRRDEGYRDSDGILHIDWLPEQKLAELIDISDICLAGHFAADIDKAKRTIPGKAYIYKAMDKPMVLGDNEANRELFAESDRIAYAVMGDPGSIVEAVEKI